MSHHSQVDNISQAFYREKLYESVLGFKDLEDFMVNFWEAWALSKGLHVLQITVR